MAIAHENVSITFLSRDDDPLEYRASVVVRDEEMVLDIPVQAIGGPYLIVGRKAQQFFAGINEIRDAGRLDVVARWANLGDAWVGSWIEEGVQYLFSFRLQKSVPQPRRSK